MQPLSTFVQQAMSNSSGLWDEATLRTLAERVAPSELGASSRWLLQGDVHALWARWFLEGIADPHHYLAEKFQRAHLYRDVLQAINALPGQVPADERVLLGRELADLLWRDVERIRATTQRISVDRELRLLLWQLHPRCWICGSLFPDWARSAFLKEDLQPPGVTYPFVDFYKARGTRLIDLRVEVEHVVAYSAGGSSDASNLRLACGWCNRAKGARTLLYDAEGTPTQRMHPNLGWISVPQPFWVVRMLAMRGRCEDPSGCTARVDNAELTVAPRNPRGSPNPANLTVVCSKHDPWAPHRLVAARFVAAAA